MKNKRNPIYCTWQGMRGRCQNHHNPAYPYYGARGIKVCEEWEKFSNFERDMGERPLNHTLDRINNDGHYEPSNCKWSSHKEQQRNRRVCITIELQGVKYRLSDLTDMCNLKRDTIKERSKYCKTLEELIDPKHRENKSGLTFGAKASSESRKSMKFCKKGHEYTPENTGLQKGGRFCKICRASRIKARNALL